ncbi:MAG TPA: thermonuclease family protein [Abditibacteriaceae bacterium]|jgi:endonuclease YncB( thermonuclease family)
MARSRNSFGGSRPLWVTVLLLVVGWAYNRYAPDSKRPSSTPSRDSSRAARTPRPDRERDSDRCADCTPTPGPAKVAGGKLIQDVVIRVSDGDTVKLKRTGSIRLIGVDTPEKAQPGGPEAGIFTRNALLNKNVQVELCAKQPYDRYGRGLGFIYVEDRNGQRVLFNRELIKAGYARVYSLRPCTVDEAAWGADYEAARSARRGLFATLGDVPDAAEYRRALRSR